MEKRTWEGAMNYCMKEGATLMQVNHPSETEVFSKHFEDVYNGWTEMWLGLKKTGMN